jgi:hypothetical protein
MHANEAGLLARLASVLARLISVLNCRVHCFFNVKDMERVCRCSVVARENVLDARGTQKGGVV